MRFREAENVLVELSYKVGGRPTVAYKFGNQNTFRNRVYMCARVHARTHLLNTNFF